VEQRRLGRTELPVSILGLGTGGANRLGQARNAGPEEVRRFVRTALDLGVTYFDSAEVYGSSEALLGDALAGVARSSYVLATKYTVRDRSGAVRTPAAVEGALHESLRLLRVDTIDVYQVHALTVETYEPVVEQQLPVLRRARDAGLIRAIGVTESFAGDDPRHEMLLRALRDDHFDVLMVGSNVLNQNAERAVFPMAQAADVGVVVMAAVRRSLASRTALEAQIHELKTSGAIPPDAVPDDDPLGFLVDHGAASVPAACYRYAMDSPAVSTILTGTFDTGHLAENAAALAVGPLPAADRDRLRAAFGHLELGLGR
jgi:aryl-alcohol dehydrogenase-like predicted oxidoreductase